MRRLLLLVALGAAVAACGAPGGAPRPAAGHPAAVPSAGAPTMPLIVPSVVPLDIAGAPPAPAGSGAADGPPPVRVRIPAIGVSSGLARLGLNADGTVQVPPDPSQAGWYVNGPAPGEDGPAVILGHLDSYTGPAVFYRLASLHPGDGVWVDRADGSQLRFVVQRVASFPVASFPTADVYGVTTEPALRLITCGGTFSYAQGRYQSNVVVFARLAS